MLRYSFRRPLLPSHIPFSHHQRLLLVHFEQHGAPDESFQSANEDSWHHREI